MKKNKTYWLWSSVLIINALLILGIALLYAVLPLDGSSGDSSSFTPEGFLVHRIIEKRTGELEVGDIITHINNISIEEWLHRSPFGRTWQKGEIVAYKIIRNNQPISLQIQLRPVPFQKVISRWGIQILTILGLFSISIFLFLNRPNDQAVRWIIFFSTTISVQYWIDAYGIQPATLLWGWVFWFHKILDQLSYSLPYTAILIFILAFLYPNGLLKRYPILLPSTLLFSGSIIKWATMCNAPTLNSAFIVGNKISVIPAMIQLALALGVSIYFLFTSQNKILLAQLRILFWGAIPSVLLTFIYSISLVLTGTPIIPSETGVIFVLFIPLFFTITILRYQIFDIEIIVKKGLVYTSLTLLSGAFYLLTVSTLTFLMQIFFPEKNHSIVDFVSILIIALIFNPLRLWVQKTIDRIFYRNKINYKELLPEMIAQLSRNIILEQLTHLLTIEFPQKLQISEASIRIFDTDKYDEKNQKITLGFREGELNIPLVIGKYDTAKEDTLTFIGEYHLGKKLSETLYTKEEINLLTTLGQQAAVSIENARLYKEIEEHNRTLENKIQERTHDLDTAKNIAENATSLLQTVMDNMDAYIYVSDIETGEILFANLPMLKDYGDIQGETCWQVLYKDKVASCSFCTNPLLIDKEGNSTGVQRREIEDKHTGRWHSIISSAIQWMDGRTVRLATRSDITEIKKAEYLLRAQEHEIAREKERRKLARDLHDTLTQSLHSLVLMADTSQRLLEQERFSVLPDSMQLLSDSARQALREMRLLLHELQLSEDEQINLQEALDTRLAIVEHRFGIKTELEVEGQKYLSRTFSREIFYIVIEALNNAIKHAECDRISISIHANRKNVEILIKDNGRGFGTKPLSDQGMGISNMKFRAEKLGGVLEIITLPQRGTAILLKVNL